MSNGIYTPIIKTTDSEIKAYAKLSKEVRDDILPIFELTRSRPVKGFPSGDIHKRMKQLIEYVDGRKIILDLTSHEDLMNHQIEELLDDTNGFFEWRKFVSDYSEHMDIIPMLHLYDDDLTSFVELTRDLSSKYNPVALRIQLDVSPQDFNRYLTEISGIIDLSTQLLLIIDAQFVSSKNIKSAVSSTAQLISAAKTFNINSITLISSSFPSSFTEHGRSEAVMSIYEIEYYKSVASAVGNRIDLTYGDYASVHPIRNRISGGNWVPRVDLSLDATYVYKRVSRDDGGYIQAAREMVSWSEYDPVECWGTKEIELASQGEPSGKSPSFWISVRINQHISRFSAWVPEMMSD